MIAKYVKEDFNALYQKKKPMMHSCFKWAFTKPGIILSQKCLQTCVYQFFLARVYLKGF